MEVHCEPLLLPEGVGSPPPPPPLPEGGLPPPSPLPDAGALGLRWLKEHLYHVSKIGADLLIDSGYLFATKDLNVQEGSNKKKCFRQTFQFIQQPGTLKEVFDTPLWN